MRAIDRFERFGTPVHNGQDYLKKHIFDRYPVVLTDNVEDLESLVWSKNFDSDYVWVVNKDIHVYDSFPWYFKPRPEDNVQIHEFPYVYRKSRKIKNWNSVRLVPTTPGDYDSRQHAYICGEYNVYKGKDKFDIFYIGKDQEQINRLTEKFTEIQCVENILEAQERSYTDMFWVVFDDTIVRDTFKFTYDPDEWSFDFVHVFGNGDIDRLDGVALIPKNYELSKREVEHRFFVSKKEIRIMASTPRSYEKFTIDTYDDYANALEKSNTDMFWGIPSDINVLDDFDFDFTFVYNDTDKKTNHVWLNDKDYDGIVLFSKQCIVSKKEIEHRFLTEKIEHNVVASVPKLYEKFELETYEDYLNAVENSKQEMFWGIPKDVVIDKSFNFDLYFTHHNKFDRNINHVFLNGEHRDGIVLYSTNSIVTEKEFDHRFITNKKEWDIVASNPSNYPVYNINSIKDYHNALQNSKSEMFWGIPNDVIIDESFRFDIYFSHHNSFDRNINHVFLNGEHYDGVVLFSKNSEITEKEFAHRFYTNKKEWDIVASTPKPYDQFTINNFEDYERAAYYSTTEMFWGIPADVKVDENFDFNLYFSHHNSFDRNMNHVFLNGKHYDGVVLFSKNLPVDKKEVDHRFYTNKKEWDIVASTPKQFDFYQIDTYEEYLDAVKNSLTDMFWMSSKNICHDQQLVQNYYISHHETQLRKQNHAFKHQVRDEILYNGLLLVSKHSLLTKNEVEHRFPINRIEHDIIGSEALQYDIFVIDDYQEYLAALENSNTEMFWVTSRNIDTSDFKFDIYFSHDNEYDRKTNHAFVHRVDSKNLYNGVFLMSKYLPVSEKEIEYRFLAEKKEWDIIASKEKVYDKFTINNYDDYTEALYNAETEMFWGIPSDVVIEKSFNFDVYFSHDNEYDRNMNHVFLNGEHYDGIVLFSKKVLVSEKEVDHRFYIKKKEWDIVASTPKPYDKFEISSYNDYENALEKSTTDMFWLTYTDINVKEDFDWNFYITHHNQYDRKINHVWRNGDYYDGIALTNKQQKLTQRELDYRFFAVKKEYEEIASLPKPFDVVFISNGETNADNNYKKLLNKIDAKRVDRVKGIHQAHIEAAKLVSTDMFWVVDGDADILDDFEFDYQIAHYDLDGRETVYVWRSFNPVNNLVYGYGGVKLLPTKLTLNMDTTKPDMTTSISKNFKGVDVMSNTTAFNTDPFSAWRSGFRECVKLASRVIDRQKDEETDFRLDAWCTRGADKPYGEYAIAGAIAGRDYGTENIGNTEALKLINDFEWLKTKFKQSYQQDE